MAKVLGGRQTVPLEEVVLAHAFQFEALMKVLERYGAVRKAEVMEEIERLKMGQPQAQRFTSLNRSRDRTCVSLPVHQTMHVAHLDFPIGLE